MTGTRDPDPPFDPANAETALNSEVTMHSSPGTPVEASPGFGFVGSYRLTKKLGEGGMGQVWLAEQTGAVKRQVALKVIKTGRFDHSADLYQPHFSPNGRWIVFEAVANLPTIAESALYVVPAAGGAWTRITDGKHWNDKPRWSPDGKTIYFVSGRGGFFNVWGIHFDPTEGKRVGELFRVSTFGRNGLMIPRWRPPVELSLDQDKLVLTMAEVSGGIWVLDNVDR